jgi:hypothetical protein
MKKTKLLAVIALDVAEGEANTLLTSAAAC